MILLTTYSNIYIKLFYYFYKNIEGGISHKMKIKTILVAGVIFILISTAISVVGQRIDISQIEEDNDESDEPIIKKDKNCALFISGAGTVDWPGSASIFARVATGAKSMFDSYGSYNTWLEIQPRRNEVKNIIENEIPNNLANNKQIFVYIGAHGDLGGSLLMRWAGILPVSISPYDLRSWFNNMEDSLNSKGKTYSKCTIVIESCYAGQHIDYLSKDNRIVITATDWDSSSYGSKAGEMYFSDAFFEAIGNGNSYGRAWEIADSVIDNNDDIQSQNPRIEDTGNDIPVGTSEPDILPIWDGDIKNPNEKDGTLAKNLKPDPKAKSKAKYSKPLILRYSIFRQLFPKLYEPRPLGF